MPPSEVIDPPLCAPRFWHSKKRAGTAVGPTSTTIGEGTVILALAPLMLTMPPSAVTTLLRLLSCPLTVPSALTTASIVQVLKPAPSDPPLKLSVKALLRLI